jgi:hypothetical protein
MFDALALSESTIRSLVAAERHGGEALKRHGSLMFFGCDLKTTDDALSNNIKRLQTMTRR